MSKMKFESALRYKEEAFIKFKKDFGHAYGSQTYHLLDFDRFCLADVNNGHSEHAARPN